MGSQSFIQKQATQTGSQSLVSPPKPGTQTAMTNYSSNSTQLKQVYDEPTANFIKQKTLFGKQPTLRTHKLRQRAMSPDPDYSGSNLLVPPPKNSQMKSPMPLI